MWYTFKLLTQQLKLTIEHKTNKWLVNIRATPLLKWLLQHLNTICKKKKSFCKNNLEAFS